MAKTNQRGRNNNNPHGHNQYTNEWIEGAKDHPVATAAAVAGAVGAGLYLWSKRDKVGNQVSRISQTANEMSSRATKKASGWIDQMRSGSSGSSNRALMKTMGPNESDAIEASRATSKRTTGSARGKSARATTGQSRKAGQNMNAGRAGAETVSY